MDLAAAHPAANASLERPLVVRGIDKRIRAVVAGDVVVDTQDAVLLCGLGCAGPR